MALRGKVPVQGLKDIAMRGNGKGFFLWRIFATWRQKKGLANPTKGFLRIKKRIRHILRKKS
jgi:hypothetical protein